MAYACPHCGKRVQRGRSRTASHAVGLLGALVYAAFASFQCETCGKVPMSEFPREVQNKARLGSVALIGGALLLLALVVGVFVFLGSR